MSRLEHFHLGGRAVLDAAFAQGVPSGRCLELASGVGGVGRYLLSRFTEVSAIAGQDLDPAMVRLAGALNRHFGVNYSLSQGNAEHLAQVDADWVLVSHLLPFVGPDFLPRLARVSGAKPVVFIEPVRLAPYAYPQVWARDAASDRLLSPDSLVARLTAAGFAVADVQDLAESLAQPLPTAAATGVPSLAEVSGLDQFAQRVANGRDGVRQGQLSALRILATAG
ncbi:MAG: class I SAM-dependent methyltransferase [Litorivicinus sp.]